MTQGDMVIVGGAELLHRAAILHRFVDMAGGPGGRFAVLASATAAPLAGFEKMRAWLGELGVDPERVELLRVSGAVAGMERGAYEAAEVERLRRADGLWLLGGDQNATIALLRGEGGGDSGGDSPLLAALRERAGRPRAAGGLVVGGTSAGAAVLSDPMIGAGTSFGALALPRATAAGEAEMSSALYVLPGFGLFGEGMIDQHFDTRARLARLLEAALVEDGARRPAFGIAEATALVYEGASRRIGVVGAGALYIVDPRPAVRRFVPTAAGPRVAIQGALLHCLTEGDSYEAATGVFDFGDKRRLAPEDAAFATPRPEASGVLSPYGGLAEFAARMLLDNDPAGLFLDPATGRRYARSLLVEEAPDFDGQPRCLGWELRLGRRLPVPAAGAGAAPSAAAYGPAPSAAGEASSEEGCAVLYYDGRYSFRDVVVDILPIEIQISRPV
ncbi:MAG: cyanophycinase [Spirochaetaceae bacterium]|nr:cyanophycinase [Spirochaetaceae bacterium]